MGWYRGKSARKGLQHRWDPLLNANTVEIYPGECYITGDKEEVAALVTTLGSCVSACVRDRRLGIGGMNHFMLPQKLASRPKSSPHLSSARCDAGIVGPPRDISIVPSLVGAIDRSAIATMVRQEVDGDEASSGAARYGDHAMELLIASILRMGGERKNLEIKVFGGATILAHMEDIGGRNIEFIKRYLATKGLKVHAEDLGGVHPRKIVYFPATGKVMVKRISPLRSSEVARHDLRYQRDLSQREFPGRSEPDIAETE